MNSTFLSIIWDVTPEIFSIPVPIIGSITVRWYGLLFALCFLVGQNIMVRIYKQEGKDILELDQLMIYMVLSTVIGARLGHCLFYQPEYYLADPIRILKVWEGGLASHGAGIGIFTGLWLYTKSTPNTGYLWLLDRVAIITASAGGFIRTGNFFNSEIIGIPTDLPWGVVFVQNLSAGQDPRHPAQMYEAISCFILFAILIFLYLKYKEKTPKGLLFGIFLSWIFTLRFCYEFLKENQVAFEDGMTLNMGQILSIPLVLTGLFFITKALSNKEAQLK